MKYHKDCAATAVQIAYEYPDWGPEHVSDMWNVVLQEGEPKKWDFNQLEDATYDADSLKRKGIEYGEAIQQLSK